MSPFFSQRDRKKCTLSVYPPIADGCGCSRHFKQLHWRGFTSSGLVASVRITAPTAPTSLPTASVWSIWKKSDAFTLLQGKLRKRFSSLSRSLMETEAITWSAVTAAVKLCKIHYCMYIEYDEGEMLVLLLGGAALSWGRVESNKHLHTKPPLIYGLWCHLVDTFGESSCGCNIAIYLLYGFKSRRPGVKQNKTHKLLTRWRHQNLLLPQ